MIANRISITITDAQKSDIDKKTRDLAIATNDFKVAIDKDTLNSLSTIADGRIPFVEKVAQFAVSNPEFLQPLADVAEFQTDFKAFRDIREVVLPMRVIVNNMLATMRVSGSEAWNFARNYYRSLQFHARMGVPGAQTILDELRPLFEAKSGSSDFGDTEINRARQVKQFVSPSFSKHFPENDGDAQFPCQKKRSKWCKKGLWRTITS